MILTCPQCATRYQAEDAKFAPAGRNVRCAKCSHLWHQSPPTPEPEPDQAYQQPEEPAVQPQERQPVRSDYAPAAERTVPETQPRPPEKPSGGWAARIGLFLGWLSLVLIVLLIGWSAVRYRQDVATVWPQSASFYKMIGLRVNSRGIAIVETSYHRGKEGGVSVLAITGKLINISARELPVPQVRVALLDSDKREIYHWLVAAPVLTLKPGEITQFKTRLSSPPPDARDLQLSFAAPGE